MIPRVGVDLVPVTRARHLVAPDRREVLCRMLGDAELQDCVRAGALDVWSVAGRLAAKEAVFKLFDAGPQILPWLGIRLRATGEHGPRVSLHGRALRLAVAAGLLSEISTSISHDGDYAIAVAAATVEPAALPGTIRNDVPEPVRTVRTVS